MVYLLETGDRYQRDDIYPLFIENVEVPRGYHLFEYLMHYCGGMIKSVDRDTVTVPSTWPEKVARRMNLFVLAVFT